MESITRLAVDCACKREVHRRHCLLCIGHLVQGLRCYKSNDGVAISKLYCCDGWLPQETFGAMAKTEKIAFILEQVGLCGL